MYQFLYFPRIQPNCGNGSQVKQCRCDFLLSHDTDPLSFSLLLSLLPFSHFPPSPPIPCTTFSLSVSLSLSLSLSLIVDVTVDHQCSYYGCVHGFSNLVVYPPWDSADSRERVRPSPVVYAREEMAFPFVQWLYRLIMRCIFTITV